MQEAPYDAAPLDRGLYASQILQAMQKPGRLKPGAGVDIHEIKAWTRATVVPGNVQEEAIHQ
jgi:hypothetical protein